MSWRQRTLQHVGIRHGRPAAFVLIISLPASLQSTLRINQENRSEENPLSVFISFFSDQMARTVGAPR